ncbi:AMP-binding protein [Desulfovibrio litoralis]|uniref:4-coumarate--CoA ligase, photoactive yellow protein activation family n=1 Tax=Desulfovibrio litoralis DSM 11393 TaxID=1121455 RepID=A0A1M7STQ6_9BACT|nr:AMP-binding protein [Desulfovibrio litoralis]SHN61927.1 4-coumarate--CoA ligase, photoactive yellow protein activation family [Desulfovibrio litoralis DSM 11393]
MNTSHFLAVIGSFMGIVPLLSEQVEQARQAEQIEQAGSVYFSGAYSQKLSACLCALSVQEKEDLAVKLLIFFDINPKLYKTLVSKLITQSNILDWAELIFECWQKSGQTFCFSSSGSTHLATRHKHSFSALLEEARSIIKETPKISRVISVMPVHHVYGFTFSIILPLALSVPSYAFAPMPTEDFFNALSPDAAVIAFPLFLKSFSRMLELQPPKTQTLPSLTIFTATAPCPKEIISFLSLKNKFKVVEVYGSTETSVIGIRLSPAQYYNLLPWWNKIDKPKNTILLIRNSQEYPLEINAPDILNFISERKFEPLMRHDKAVQVGGENVYLQKVEAILLSHPDIKDCAVRLMLPKEGDRLKAFIVPLNNTKECLKRLSGVTFRVWLHKNLSSASIPKHITYGVSVPLSTTGKRCDWSITTNINTKNLLE